MSNIEDKYVVREDGSKTISVGAFGQVFTFTKDDLEKALENATGE